MDNAKRNPMVGPETFRKPKTSQKQMRLRDSTHQKFKALQGKHRLTADELLSWLLQCHARLDFQFSYKGDGEK